LAFYITETFDELKIIDTRGTDNSASLSSIITGLSHLLTHANFTLTSLFKGLSWIHSRGRDIASSKKLRKKTIERKRKTNERKKKKKDDRKRTTKEK
jgi:hypothetical protein